MSKLVFKQAKGLSGFTADKSFTSQHCSSEVSCQKSMPLSTTIHSMFHYFVKFPAHN